MVQRRPIKRLPLDLPKPRVRDTAYGYRGRTSNNYDEMGKTSSLFRKIFITVAIIFVIVILKNIDTGFTQNIVEYVRTGITGEFNMDEALGKLKFVGDFLPDSKAVFGDQSDMGQEQFDQTVNIEPFFTVPAEGKVSTFFSENNPGIDILGDKNDKIYAVAQGTVMNIEENDKDGKALKINHGDDIISQYKGCSTILVHIGDQVTKGEGIGTMGSNPAGGYTMRFEAWVGNKPVDPLKLIEKVR
ncbi:MAG TPA: M23 family metallopeptidase [Clostridia bacterium]|nr:M23 family metallopeptidase [Clostridia bacterium]